MKHLSLSQHNDPGKAPEYYKLSIMSTTEKWTLSATVREEDRVTERETAIISWHLPNGKFFEVTVNDMMAMEKILQNAKANLMEYASAGFTDKQNEEEVLDCCKEMDHLLGMFKQHS